MKRLVLWCGLAAAGVWAAPEGLTVEYRENPCGIDCAQPRFGWRATDGRSMSAWRVLVASSAEKLARDEGDVWDSERTAGCRSVGIVYGGAQLKSSARYFWKVMTWDERGQTSGWSAPAEWTCGVMPGDTWKAKWIGPAPETRPDEDFGAAQWITAPADAKGVTELSTTFVFDGCAPGQFVEMVHAGVTQHAIDVNGKPFNRWSGQVHDWRYLRFRDMTPWLVKGTNTVTVRVTGDKPKGPGDPYDPIRAHAAADVRAFLAKIVFPDGRVLGTDAAGWTSPGGAVTALGRARETSYGKQLVMRAENTSPAFAKTFTVTKPVAEAVLHVTGAGWYEAALNGVKIGKKVLDPSPTAFDKRVLYSTYRLDRDLKPGANELRLLVGHGWYDMRSVATWNFETAPWRDFPRAIAQLEIVYADGTRETVATDGTWRHVRSPVAYDDLFEGEVTGAVAPRGPDVEKNELHAVEVAGPGGRLVAEAHPGAEVMRTVKAKEVRNLGGGAYLFDFGENIAGWMRMILRGQKKGDVVSFRYDERDGDTRRIDVHFRYTASQRVYATDAAFQTDRFVCSGAAAERYEPRFQYAGFRYVLVKGLARAPAAADAEACVVHTAFPTIGSFECSDATFNKLMEMGDKAYRGNFADGVPTDCPHREKNGWTGDASIASELAQFCYENTAAYEKWLRDIADAQLPDGNIPGIVPTSGWGYHWGNGPAWDSALSVVAWNLWTYRDDRRVIDEVYPVLKKYLAYTATRADKEGLVRHGLGDWVPVDKAHYPSLEYTSSCYYYQAQRIAAEMARVKALGIDARKYDAAAEKTRKAIYKKYHKGGGVFDNGFQTAQAFALAYGIAPPAERAAVAAKLAEAVERAEGHIDVGLLGSKQLFRALSRAGRGDLAWRILTNPTKPSMTEWIQKGGTTLWEDWGDGASRNHIMFGDFVGWAYQYLAGIRLPETENSTSAVPTVTARAFKEIVIEPSVFAAEGLTWVRATVESPYGTIASAWKRDGTTVTLEAEIPPNTSACLRLPGVPAKRVGPGRHTLTCELK